MVYLFGEFLNVYVVFAVLAIATICLFFLRLHILLLFTLVALLLTSLDTPLRADARILRWAFLAALLVKGLTGAGGGLFPYPMSRAHRFIGGLAIMVTFSYFYSIGPNLTLAQGAMLLVLWGAVFAVLWNSWSDADAITQLSNTFFRLAVLLFTAQAIYLPLNLGSVVEGMRFSGIFLNPNGAGSAVVFLAPFVYWKFRTSSSGFVRGYIRILAVFMLMNLVLSGARSAWVGGIISLGVIFTYVYRVRTVALMVVIAIPFVFLAVFGWQLDDEVVEGYVRTDTLVNLSDRIPMWERGWVYFEERPILGYGYGMNKFVEYGRADYTLSQTLDYFRSSNYHNSHLQLALDLGAVGIVLFWGFMLTVIGKGISLFRRARHTDLDLAGVVFFGTFLTLAADSFVHGWVFSPGSSMSIVFFVVAAATVRVHMLAEEADIEAGAEETAAEEQTSRELQSVRG